MPLLAKTVEEHRASGVLNHVVSGKEEERANSASSISDASGAFSPTLAMFRRSRRAKAYFGFRAGDPQFSRDVMNTLACAWTILTDGFSARSGGDVASRC